MELKSINIKCDGVSFVFYLLKTKARITANMTDTLLMALIPPAVAAAAVSKLSLHLKKEIQLLCLAYYA